MKGQLERKTEFQYQPYAITDDKSQGRIGKERHHRWDFRSEFHHDRDRIIHSKAFRRLDGKTQVALIHESDHSRNRLTHSLEVSQISENISISLGINQFATLAIALGHDLGHTPFGHGGERALNEILYDFGMKGFKHNYQGVLIVNDLEERYDKRKGMNLLLETRDGILKHTKLRSDLDVAYYDEQIDPSKNFPITMEGQVVSSVDEIAQRTHDTDDGLRTNRIKLEDLVKQPVIQKSMRAVSLNENTLINDFGKKKEIVISSVIIALIKYYVYNLLQSSYDNLKLHNIRNYNDILKASVPIVDFDKIFKKEDKAFAKNFLRPRFYEHYEIKRMDSRAAYFIKQIFKAFKMHPMQLPENTFTKFLNAIKIDLEERLKSATGNFRKELKEFLSNPDLSCKDSCLFLQKSKTYSESQRKKSKCPLCKFNKPACEGIRVIVNYLSGMTDRHAHLEYSRLYFPPEISRL